MKFKEAIKLVKEGEKVRRRAWLKEEFFKENYLHSFYGGINIFISFLGKSNPYNPSFEDVFADDWEIVPFPLLKSYSLFNNRQCPKLTGGIHNIT